MKQVIRLTESDLHKIVKTSVNKILKEVNIGAWAEHNNIKYKQAVDVLSKHVLEYIDIEDIINDPDIVELEVHECWQDVLEEDLVNAIYDKYDIACVTHKNCYGGGGYEVLR